MGGRLSVVGTKEPIESGTCPLLRICLVREKLGIKIANTSILQYISFCRLGRKGDGDGWETKCCRDKRANRSAAHTPPQSRHYHNMTHLAQKTQQKKTKQSQRDKDNTNANTRHNMSVRSSKMNLIGPRVAKCHGDDELIRVKILASLGKSLESTQFCKIWVFWNRFAQYIWGFSV